MHEKKYRNIYVVAFLLLAVLLAVGCGQGQNASTNNKMKIQPQSEQATNVAKEESGATDSNVGSEDSTAVEGFTLGQTDTATGDNNNAGQASDTAEESGISQELMDSLANDANQQQNTDDSTKEESDAGKEEDYGEPDAAGRVGYHCDIEADKKDFDGTVDIVVGDNLYATQINDWYENFDQYEGKSVEIEGFCINEYPPYTFVGRYGPSCPYCNGGFVSFEFYTKDDMSGLKPEKDWIKVKGILRQGKDQTGTFYYIEVLSWEKMDQAGKDTVTN